MYHSYLVLGMRLQICLLDVHISLNGLGWHIMGLPELPLEKRILLLAEPSSLICFLPLYNFIDSNTQLSLH